MTADSFEALAARHEHMESPYHRGSCAKCLQVWPCSDPVTQLIADWRIVRVVEDNAR